MAKEREGGRTLQACRLGSFTRMMPSHSPGSRQPIPCRSLGKGPNNGEWSHDDTGKVPVSQARGTMLWLEAVEPMHTCENLGIHNPQDKGYIISKPLGLLALLWLPCIHPCPERLRGPWTCGPHMQWTDALQLETPTELVQCRTECADTKEKLANSSNPSHMGLSLRCDGGKWDLGASGM